MEGQSYYYNSEVKLICENCGYSKGDVSEGLQDYIAKIKREIYRRIRTGQWEKHSQKDCPRL